MAHASTTRLKLKKGRGDNRICQVHRSGCWDLLFMFLLIELENIREYSKCTLLYPTILTILSPPSTIYTLILCMHSCIFLQVYDSPTLPESECGFSLGPAGIEDAKDA